MFEEQTGHYGLFERRGGRRVVPAAAIERRRADEFLWDVRHYAIYHFSVALLADEGGVISSRCRRRHGRFYDDGD